MHDVTIDEQMTMMWRNYIEEDLDMFIDMAKILSEKSCDATLERPNHHLCLLLIIHWQC